MPSKTLLRAAGALHTVNAIPFAEVDGSAHLPDFAAVRAQKDALVAELRQAKYLDIVAFDSHVQLVEGRARWVAADAVEVGGAQIRADASRSPLACSRSFRAYPDWRRRPISPTRAP